MIVVTLTLTALLCLAFNSTRLIGVVGLAILFCIFPLMFAAFLIMGAVIIHLILYKRSPYHVLRKFLTRRN